MKASVHSCSARRSVSGKRVCSYCNNILGKGAAMIIESLGLCYHLHCFKVRLRRATCRPAKLCLEERMASCSAGVDVPLTDSRGASPSELHFESRIPCYCLVLKP